MEKNKTTFSQLKVSCTFYTIIRGNIYIHLYQLCVPLSENVKLFKKTFF